jgi:hypothetical protein
MTLSTDQMVQAEAAKRLLSDDAFLAILTRITSDAAEKAVFGDDRHVREVNRQLVLAISRIRGELQADADMPEADKAAEQLNRAMEG